MTLTEFLLARITEDEAVARSGFSHTERWVRSAPTGTPTGLSCPAVLAECEAKRRIVEAAMSVGWVTTQTFLPILALPYADHPDYLPEWKP